MLLLLAIYVTGSKLAGALRGSQIIGFIAGAIGKELKTDGYSHTNILLLGVGGEAHEGKDLTDTIILASLNHQENSVALLSIPRDFYVESTLGGMRVNRLYEKGKLQWNSEEGLDFMRDTIAEIIKLPIHYVVKVDFKAFEETVDALGGIDVYVGSEINDLQYPKDGTFEYEPFYLPAGQQHLDGKTALKYVRSRKTTSDFDRSKRQQDVLIALKDKAEQENALSRRKFLRDFYYSVDEHVETDMSFRETLALAEFGTKINMDKILSATLNDEPIFEGGFLYTPLRELYGGAFVLLPAGDSLNSVRNFADLVLYGPQDIKNFPVAILNGTKQNGTAGTAKGILHRFGWFITAVGNAWNQDLENTTWYVLSPEAAPFADALQKLIPGNISRTIPPLYKEDPKLASRLAEAKIILEIGKNSIPIIEKLDIFHNIVPLAPATGTSTSPAPAAPAAAS